MTQRQHRDPKLTPRWRRGPSDGAVTHMRALKCVACITGSAALHVAQAQVHFADTTVVPGQA
jgi:hypothetical protein